MQSINFQLATRTIASPFLSISTPSINILNFNTFPNKTLSLTHFNFKCLSSPQPSPSSLDFDSTSFQVSYLVHNFDFSPEFASKVCSTYRLRFKTTKNPDAVINFFTNYGFSDSQLRRIIIRSPWLLSCNLYTRIIPKFEFFLSKGASNSDILNLITMNSRLLSPSLENHIVPTYNLLYVFLQSDMDVIASVIKDPSLLCHHYVPRNIILLIENGVSDSNIAGLLRRPPPIFYQHELLNYLEELKDLGFDPLKTTFYDALMAKASSTKEKLDVFKKWGWSDEDVIKAFKKYPRCMIISIEKINLGMNFWVNQLGWDALALTEQPVVLCYNLEKRIAPRAVVVQFLLNNGLRHKNASLTSPFIAAEKVFRDRFIKRFEKESSYLLKLYEEKLKLAYTGDKNCMS